MTNHSPHHNSMSPHSKPPTSAFQWPIPQASGSSEISIREILDHYSSDPDLLKCILTAKSEEDKKKSARDTLKAEEARIQLRHMDLEMAREQSKSRAPPYTYGLAPVQQQVLARFNHHPYSQYQRPLPPPQEHRPPPSPAIPHPHSAHPLCPPSSEYRMQSNADERSSLKRNRNSISNEMEHQLSHDKVMEALKAKIQRSSSHSLAKDNRKTKQTFRPIKVDIAVNSPSPKSAKPILPPIDTSVGRAEHTIVEETSSTASNNSNDISESKKLSPVECRPYRSLSPP